MNEKIRYKKNFISEKFCKNINEILYLKLWKQNDSILKKLVYLMLPFALLVIFYIIIDFQNAAIVEAGYGFINDITNVCVLSYMFIVVYYLNGYYSVESEICIKQYAEKSNLGFLMIHICSILSMCAGIFFIYISKLNGQINWYDCLLDWQFIYYVFLIACSWYMSTNLVLRSLRISAKVFKLANDSIKVDLYHNDGCAGIKDVFSLFTWHIGFAVYFIFSSLLIFYSDFNAVNYGVYNAFYKYPILCFGAFFVAALYGCFIFISFYKIKISIDKKITIELERKDITEKEIEKLEKIKKSFFSFKNICKYIFPIFFQIITSVIIEFIERF